MLKYMRWILPLVFVAASLAWVRSARTAAGTEAKLARAATAQALKDAAQAATAAGQAQARSDTLQAQRDSALKRANTHARDLARLKGALSHVASAAPDTCQPIIVLADSALAAADSVERDLRTALDRSQQSEQSLQAAVDTLVPALQHLRAASTVLVKADAKLSRRALLVRLLPRPGVGVGVGFDGEGKPRVITGITLSWTF